VSIESKIGAMVKLVTNHYWDKKFGGKNNTFHCDLPAMFSWSTKVQSIDYLYLMESLKNFPIVKNDTILDLGCGKGRTLLYCNYKYNKLEKKNIIFYGAEINKEAYILCKEICSEKNITVENINALDDNYLLKNKFNKILLFNPFNEVVFLKFIQSLQKNNNYSGSFLYINISQKQIDILNKENIDFEQYLIHKPLFGIWNKVNVVVNMKENKNEE
jgi:cyclopropane fatty-acyl-phospholipid synthase-like methyltransferase